MQRKTEEDSPMSETRNRHQPGDAPVPAGGVRPEDPLPRDWLPQGLPPAHDLYWEGAAARTVVILEPFLAAGKVGTEAGARSWVAEMGDRWGAAALLAAAAVVLLLGVGTWEASMEPLPGPDDRALVLLAVEGDPARLWEEMGVAADPVFAWLAFEGVRP
jgi:hypothetical protein